MDLPNPFKLEQLTIKPQPERTGVKPFVAMFNPNQYTMTYRNRQIVQPTINNEKDVVKPSGQEPNIFSVKLILDSTGVTGLDAMFSGFGIATTSVQDKIKDFRELCFDMKDKEHSPLLVHVKWGMGMIDFNGFLESLSINYSLFDQAGKPLRAELDTTFIEQASGEQKKQSPDLTHIRTVYSGDTLPLLAKEMYGSSRYYLFVAEANNLDDFRNLEPGTKLHFPPLEEV